MSGTYLLNAWNELKARIPEIVRVRAEAFPEFLKYRVRTQRKRPFEGVKHRGHGLHWDMPSHEEPLVILASAR